MPLWVRTSCSARQPAVALGGGAWRATVAVVGTCVSLVAVPPAARAATPGTVGVTGTTLTFQAGPATANVIRVFHIATQETLPPHIEVFDLNPVVDVQAGTGCQIAFTNRAACPLSDPISRVVVLLGDGNDKVSTVGFTGPNNSMVRDGDFPLPMRVNGGPGNDELGGGRGPDVLVGGAGVNTARGLDGNDRLLMRNGVRDALIDCGEGTDTAVIDSNDPRPVACETVLKPR